MSKPNRYWNIEMTNLEVAEHLRKWCEAPPTSPFSWPTDACGYDQHIKFVEHRNAHWTGRTTEEFVQFVLAYAAQLEGAC